MLTVYTRHHPECKNASDKTWRRCNCPKWIWGSLNGKFLRQSARTHSWEVAEELRRQLIEGATQPSQPAAETQPSLIAPSPVPLQARVHPPDAAEEIDPVKTRKARVTIEKAVESYLADARSRELKPATLSKLETIFRKQFLLGPECKDWTTSIRSISTRCSPSEVPGRMAAWPSRKSRTV